MGCRWCSPTAATTTGPAVPGEVDSYGDPQRGGGEPIPLYGDGLNVRDWLYVDDHVDTLLLAATRGRPGQLLRGGNGERNNSQVVEAICSLMNQLHPQGAPHARLITMVNDRPGTTDMQSTPR